MTTIQARVLNVLSEQLGFAVAEIRPEHELRETLNCDSLDIVEVMMGLEEEFGIDINDDKFAALVTVQDVVDYISVAINIDSRADRAEICDALSDSAEVDNLVRGVIRERSAKLMNELTQHPGCITHHHACGCREHKVAVLKKAALDVTMELDHLKNELDTITPNKLDDLRQMIERCHTACSEVEA